MRTLGFKGLTWKF